MSGSTWAASRPQRDRFDDFEPRMGTRRCRSAYDAEAADNKADPPDAQSLRSGRFPALRAEASVSRRTLPRWTFSHLLAAPTARPIWHNHGNHRRQRQTPARHRRDGQGIARRPMCRQSRHHDDHVRAAYEDRGRDGSSRKALPTMLTPGKLQSKIPQERGHRSPPCFSARPGRGRPVSFCRIQALGNRKAAAHVAVAKSGDAHRGQVLFLVPGDDTRSYRAARLDSLPHVPAASISYVIRRPHAGQGRILRMWRPALASAWRSPRTAGRLSRRSPKFTAPEPPERRSTQDHRRLWVRPRISVEPARGSLLQCSWRLERSRISRTDLGGERSRQLASRIHIGATARNESAPQLHPESARPGVGSRSLSSAHDGTNQAIRMRLRGGAPGQASAPTSSHDRIGRHTRRTDGGNHDRRRRRHARSSSPRFSGARMCSQA